MQHDAVERAARRAWGSSATRWPTASGGPCTASGSAARTARLLHALDVDLPRAAPRTAGGDRPRPVGLRRAVGARPGPGPRGATAGRARHPRRGRGRRRQWLHRRPGDRALRPPLHRDPPRAVAGDGAGGTGGRRPGARALPAARARGALRRHRGAAQADRPARRGVRPRRPAPGAGGRSRGRPAGPGRGAPPRLRRGRRPARALRRGRRRGLRLLLRGVRAAAGGGDGVRRRGGGDAGRRPARGAARRRRAGRARRRRRPGRGAAASPRATPTTTPRCATPDGAPSRASPGSAPRARRSRSTGPLGLAC